MKTFSCKKKNFKKYFQKRLQTIDIILGFA